MSERRDGGARYADEAVKSSGAGIASEPAGVVAAPGDGSANAMLARRSGPHLESLPPGDDSQVAAAVDDNARTIVNFSSSAGVFGVPNMVAYSAAKHGVVGLTKALAVEWARAGVRVNCVCPGATLTPMLMATSQEYRDGRTERVPLGRLGEPVDQALAAVFLLSDDAAYVTGTALPVDGGISALAPGTAAADINQPKGVT